MKRTTIAVSLLLAAGMSTGCSRAKNEVLPDGTKLFGERTLKDGTKKTDRIEFPDGQKDLDEALFPDGSRKIGCVELPSGIKLFGETVLTDGTRKIAHSEFPNGEKDFDVTFLVDGTAKKRRIEFSNGERDFDVTVLPNGTATIGRAEFSDGTKQFDVTQAPNGTRTVKVSGEPTLTLAASTSEAAKPVAAKPQHLQWQLYLLDSMTLRGGMTKQEIERALFNSESVSRELSRLTCTKPYENDNKAVNIKDVVVCKTFGMVERGTVQTPVMLSFEMGTDNALNTAKEALPLELADDARSFLSEQFGQPSSYAPTSWQRSTGCSKNVNGVRLYPPGQCASIHLEQGNLAGKTSNQNFYEWESITWTDFIRDHDIQEAEKQARTPQ